MKPTAAKSKLVTVPETPSTTEVVKLTNGQVLYLRTSIQQVANMKIPFDVSYAVVRNTAVVEAETAVIEKMRSKFVEAHLPEGQKEITQADAQFKPFMDDYTKFLNQTTELKLQLINTDDLKSLTLTPATVNGLVPMFK